MHTLKLFAAVTGFAVLALTAGRAQTSPSHNGSEKSHPTPSQGVHWSYTGTTGPDHWAELEPVCETCGLGKAQSPINLTNATARVGISPQLDYSSPSLHIDRHEKVESLVDNGHTIQVTLEEGSTFTTASGTYRLKQFHFHTPSEHAIDGHYQPMEAHFVYQSAEGHLAVVGILFVEGSPNENLAKLIANFPTASGQSANLPAAKIDLYLQLPADRTAYTYKGSLTTPPCSEGVEWYVFRQPVSASREQLAAFSTRMHENHRPLQPLNGRTIETVTIGGSDAASPPASTK